MRRLSAKCCVVCGSAVVLFTTFLLWLQCHHTSLVHSNAPQNRRVPLQMNLRTTHAPMVHDSVGIVSVSDGDDYTREEPVAEKEEEEQDGVTDISCLINQETTINCKRDTSEVYVPFSFLQQYFEVYGYLQSPKHKGKSKPPPTAVGEYDPPPSAASPEQTSPGGEVFMWQHSYSKVFAPSLPYSPFGTFLNFQLYTVENRDRVKCVSARDGVPISTQWLSSGHAYPIQIAQYGLAHYCKMFTEPPPRRRLLEDASSTKASWLLSSSESLLERTDDSYRGGRVISFRTRDCSIGGRVSGGIRLPLSPSGDQMTLSLDWFIQHNVSLTVTYVVRERKTYTFHVHYLPSDVIMWTNSPRDIFYGVGLVKGWRKFTRNLLVDLHKGIALLTRIPRSLKKVSRSNVQVTGLQLCGEGQLDNITLSTAEHRQHFYHAADWLMLHQDSRGGWRINAPRTVVKGILQLPSGWYSAMAQGQAISLLVRAAHHSGDRSYLESANRALALYSANATQGGVRTFFSGGFVWYEEYPTTPSLFVLNGFIYSLLGLYDLKEAGSSADREEASRLFREGMTSLKTLLPLFDTGWGSLYDLRHFTAHIAPKPARWDYHTTHITQLLLLASIDDDPVISSTAARWTEYMKGKRASHN